MHISLPDHRERERKKQYPNYPQNVPELALAGLTLLGISLYNTRKNIHISTIGPTVICAELLKTISKSFD
jgi:hypothetical protein